jgi:hypothetical protein
MASGVAFVPMASSQERESVAAFVRELYELGGFNSWGEYAREAGFLASSMSDWSRGKNAPSGPTLVRLIHTATDRAPLALREAAERTSPLRQVHDRLQELEGSVAESVALTREALQRLGVERAQSDAAQLTPKATRAR